MSLYQTGGGIGEANGHKAAAAFDCDPGGIGFCLTERIDITLIVDKDGETPGLTVTADRKGIRAAFGQRICHKSQKLLLRNRRIDS